MFNVKRYLSEKNALETDRSITFEEEGHLYRALSPYSGQWVSKYDGGGSIPVESVTGLIGNYFPKTDFTFIARRVLNSAKHKELVFSDSSYRYYRCTSVVDIQRVWGRGAEEGTRMHAAFEDLANIAAFELDQRSDESTVASIDESDDGNDDDRRLELAYVAETNPRLPEYRYFNAFLRYFGVREGRHELYRTEYSMFHPELQIAGMIDGLLYDPDYDGYIIFDYKRTRNGLAKPPLNPKKPVHELSSNSRGMLLPELRKSRNLPIIKYGIQLTLYKNMFERMHPRKRILGLYLVVVDSERIGKRQALEIISVPLDRHQQAVDEIFDARARRIVSEYHQTMTGDHVAAAARLLLKPDDFAEDFMDAETDTESDSDGYSTDYLDDRSPRHE